jgi:hypothetical protein
MTVHVGTGVHVRQEEDTKTVEPCRQRLESEHVGFDAQRPTTGAPPSEP